MEEDRGKYLDIGIRLGLSEAQGAEGKEGVSWAQEVLEDADESYREGYEAGYEKGYRAGRRAGVIEALIEIMWSRRRRQRP